MLADLQILAEVWVDVVVLVVDVVVLVVDMGMVIPEECYNRLKNKPCLMRSLKPPQV
jgi:hypothetical protein